MVARIYLGGDEDATLPPRPFPCYGVPRERGRGLGATMLRRVRTAPSTPPEASLDVAVLGRREWEVVVG